MINAKDVIRMKIPHPDSRSGLAVTAHMYICERNTGRQGFVKCQTYKPTIRLKHHCDEEPDITRNPFTQKTMIDCDKLFLLDGLSLDDRLKTKPRPDVCDELFDDVIKELNADGYKTIIPDKNETIRLNPLIR